MSKSAEELRLAAARLRPSSPSVAEHTVAVRLHPDVATALADWLEFQAAMDERFLALVDGAPSMDDATWDGKPHPALVVARALVREDGDA